MLFMYVPFLCAAMTPAVTLLLIVALVAACHKINTSCHILTYAEVYLVTHFVERMAFVTD